MMPLRCLLVNISLRYTPISTYNTHDAAKMLFTTVILNGVFSTEDEILDYPKVPKDKYQGLMEYPRFS